MCVHPARLTQRGIIPVDADHPVLHLHDASRIPLAVGVLRRHVGSDLRMELLGVRVVLRAHLLRIDVLSMRVLLAVGVRLLAVRVCLLGVRVRLLAIRIGLLCVGIHLLGIGIHMLGVGVDVLGVRIVAEPQRSIITDRGQSPLSCR